MDFSGSSCSCCCFFDCRLGFCSAAAFLGCGFVGFLSFFLVPLLLGFFWSFLGWVSAAGAATGSAFFCFLRCAAGWSVGSLRLALLLVLRVLVVVVAACFCLPMVTGCEIVI